MAKISGAKGAARLPLAEASQQQAPPQAKQQEVWNSSDDLFWDHMREVQNKWNTLKLNDDIWAKLIYFEQNRRLAKAYVSTPVLTIDGSTNGLDGFRIGLSGIENSYRDLDSIACLRSIGHGIKLKIDQQGNILVRKIGPPPPPPPPTVATNAANANANANANSNSCSIWIKEWPSASATKRHSALTHSLTSNSNSNSTSSSSASSASGSSDYSRLTPLDLWPMQEITNSELPYKLFDMKKFRRQLERQSGTPIDWRQCVSIISFVRQAPATSRNKGAIQRQLLSDPCWIMLINIIAIDMLKSSICDENHASSPRPTGQISLMIDKYQHQARQGRFARKPNATGATDASNQAANGIPQLKTSSSVASLYSARRQVNQWRPHEEEEEEEEEPLESETQTGADFHRLPRLSNLAGPLGNSAGNLHGKLANSLRSNHMESGLRSSSQQLALLANSARTNGSSTSSSSNNAIYTTFTGKYLDKQQRRKRLSSSNNWAAGQPTEQLAAHGVDSMKSDSRNGAGSKWRAHSPESKFEKSVTSSRPADLYEGLARIPFARKPTGELQQKQMSHSMSAFDLSHGHKLNLQSLKSIKMNFDSDHEEKEIQHEDSNEMGGREKYGPSERGPASRRALLAFSNETSEWANLAKKYAARSTSGVDKLAEEAEEEEQQQQQQQQQQPQQQQQLMEGDDFQRSNSTISSSQLFVDEIEDEGAESERKRDSTETASADKEDRQKVSRSAASSSSGCADNDYFISQSSSSMSSSTHTSNGAIDQGLTSQPASSSGIAGLDNSSDECDREPPEAPSNSKGRKVASKNGDKKSAASKRGVIKSLPSDGPQTCSQESCTSARQKAIEPRLKSSASARNRRNESKRLASSDHQLNDRHNGFHYDCCPGDWHVSQMSDEEQCDCILADGDLDGQIDTCDCCCDCFYQPETGCDNKNEPPNGSNPSAGRWGCDAVAEEADEEPIYDHLPRFGHSPAVPITTTKPRGRNKFGAQRPKNNSCSDLTASMMINNNHNDIVSIPMPSIGEDSSGNTKGGPIKEPKRGNGWLERRKYIRLFPKFMFSSSSSSSAAESTPRLLPSPTRKLGASSSVSKSNELSASRIRRTKSSQNLSR